MKPTSNKDKARELAIEYENLCVIDLEDLALKAMEWKEQQMIDYIYNHAHVTTFGDIRLEKCSVAQFIEDIKKSMEEEL